MPVHAQNSDPKLRRRVGLSAVVVAILDMEYPRAGFNLLGRADAMLVDLRQTMH